MDIDKLTSIEQLRDDQRELAEVLGIEAYKRLIKYYGGTPLYVQKASPVAPTPPLPNQGLEIQLRE